MVNLITRVPRESGVGAGVAYVRLALAVDNVLDRDYEQFIGYPGRGRRTRVEMAVEL